MLRIALTTTFVALVFAGCGAPSGQDDAAGSGPSGQTGAVSAGPARDDINVIWILLDACRADHLSAYGYERKTSPHLEALAARGALFERHYAQGPATLISVPSYMTGRHFPVGYQDAQHLGVWFLKTPPADEKLVSTIFKENGYATGMFSASPWYSRESRLGKSFDEFQLLVYGPLAPPEVSNVQRQAHLFKWIEDHAQQKFFLYVHALDTHEPRYRYNTTATWLNPAFPAERDQELRKWKGDSFSPEDQQHLVDLYDGGVQFADSTVGDILAALERLEIDDRTIVVISSDHGEALAEDGKTLGHPQTECYDDLLRTPLIIAGPGVPAGVRVPVWTENTDIVPTLVELAGLETTAKFDGVALGATMRTANPDPVRDHAFAKTAAFMFNTVPNQILVFDDAKFDIGPYNDEELEYLKMPLRPKEFVYAMPDALGSRKAIEPPAAAAARARQLATTTYGEAWKKQDALPVEVPGYFETSFGRSLEAFQVVDTFEPADNLWTRYSAPYLFRNKESQLLLSDPATEDAKGLVMVVDVPNGNYHVYAYSKTLDLGGPPRGSSFRILRYLPGDAGETTFRLFQIPAPEPGETNDQWFELGTYAIDDGKFVYWFDEGEREDLTVLGAFRFVQVGREDEVPTDEASLEEIERLNALGYLVPGGND